MPAAPGCRLHGHLWAAEERKAAWVRGGGMVPGFLGDA